LKPWFLPDLSALAWMRAAAALVIGVRFAIVHLLFTNNKEI